MQEDGSTQGEDTVGQLNLHARERNRMPRNWNDYKEVCVYAPLDDDMKRIVDEAVKRGLQVTGKNTAAIESLQQHLRRQSNAT